MAAGFAAELSDADVFLYHESRDRVELLNTPCCDRRNGTFMYGLGIGREHRRRGYALEATGLVLRYFFEELRYQKGTVHVYGFNEASVRLHEKAGFTMEGRIRRMVYTDGEYHDEIVFGMTAEEWRELRKTRWRFGENSAQA